MKPIPAEKIVPASMLKGDSPEDTKLLQDMCQEAQRFLMSFDWCRDITESYFGRGIGGVVAVFLYRIEPTSPHVDEWLWVIIGDLPPAYLVTADSPDPASALESYIYEMNRWVDAAEQGKSLEDVIPVNVAATANHTEQLKSRLKFLEDQVLPRWRELRADGPGKQP